MAGIHTFDQGAEPEDHWGLPCRRVLVVDDDRDFVDSQAVLLETLGQDVRCAYDGATALRIALDFRPHLVLLDIGMPAMGGLEVARRLRVLRPTRDARLIAQTGVCGSGPDKASAPPGFDGYIRKPAPLATLITVLRAIPAGPVAPDPALASSAPTPSRSQPAEPGFFDCYIRD